MEVPRERVGRSRRTKQKGRKEALSESVEVEFPFDGRSVLCVFDRDGLELFLRDPATGDLHCPPAGFARIGWARLAKFQSSVCVEPAVLVPVAATT